MKRGGYNKKTSTRFYLAEGERVRCYIKAVSHFPEKGGDAHGRRARDESPAYPGVVYHCAVFDDCHGPKSVLTAW